MEIAIIGLGQIGGSLAWALKTSGLACKIHGYDKNKNLLGEAFRRNIVDHAASDLENALEKAALAFLAVPSNEIMRLIPIATSIMHPGSILIDVGSTKGLIVAEMEKSGGKVRCLGGHPIAGSELSGPSSWNPDLFAGKSFVLVRTQSSTRRVENLLDDILSKLGARVTFMKADEHDKTLAITSHLPYILGCALTALVDRNCRDAGGLTGGAFRSATRVVASSSEMRADICITNREKLIKAYEAFDREARSLLKLCTSGRDNLQAAIRKLQNIHKRIMTDDENGHSANPVSSRNTEGSRR